MFDLTEIKSQDDLYVERQLAYRDKIVNEEIGNTLQVTVCIGNDYVNPNAIVFNEFETFLNNCYGGFTRLHGTGGYKSNTMDIKEASVIYLITMQVDKYERLTDMLHHVKVELKQEAILVNRQFVNSEVI